MSQRPLHSSFDRDAARQAWRQFARLHGADRRREGPSAPKLSLIIGGVVVAAGLVFGAAQLGGEELKPAQPAGAGSGLSEAAMTQRRAAPTVDGGLALAAKSRTSRPAASGGGTSVAGQAAKAVVHFRPTPVDRATPRVTPVGASANAAKAFLAVPKGERDRSPVGGVGGTGIHVDRISMGTGFANSRCTGPANNFSIGRGEPVHVCFRTVHLRQAERLRVVWEHEGRRALQTRLRIPSRHAFRTRAGLHLQGGYAGHWRVSVQSADGAELASAQFDVAP